MFSANSLSLHSSIGSMSSSSNRRQRKMSFTPFTPVTPNRTLIDLAKATVSIKERSSFHLNTVKQTSTFSYGLKSYNSMENEPDSPIKLSRPKARATSNVSHDSLYDYKNKLGLLLNKAESQEDIDILCDCEVNEEELLSLSSSSSKELLDFYNYTNDSFQIIQELLEIKEVNKCKPVKFDFSDQIGKGKRLAIFDLDETLVHAEYKNIEKCEHIIDVVLPSKKVGKIGINIRPKWKELMNLIKDKYEIVIYTASHKSYCDSVLDFMDPNKIYFPYRLYRNHCSSVKYDGKEIYIKDLSVFEDIDPKDMIIVDNSVISFTYNIDNGLPIVPFYDSKSEAELVYLAYYLNYIYHYDDLRKANKKFVKLHHYMNSAINQEEISDNSSTDSSEDKSNDQKSSQLSPELQQSLEEIRNYFKK